MSAGLLVDFYEAHNVGHALEALRFALGYSAANPGLRTSVLLNAATTVELARLSPFLDQVHTVTVPGYPDRVREREDEPVDLAGVPQEWDWVLDNPRRVVEPHVAAVPGFRRYYDAADLHFRPSAHHGLIRGPGLPYAPHQHLRLELPAEHRERALASLPAGPRVAVIPAGSSEPWLYPSIASWETILRGMAAAMPDLTVVVIGKLAADGRTTTSIDRAGLARLLAAVPGTVDAVDTPLLHQLALLEACDVLVAPHTGFAFTASTVGTPWLAISGGRWPEWFFNGVPVLSVLPDPARHPWFTAFGAAPVHDDADGEGLRAPSLSRARIADDLDAIVAGTLALSRGEIGYEAALAAYFPQLLAAADGDRSRIFSMDDLHLAYL